MLLRKVYFHPITMSPFVYRYSSELHQKKKKGSEIVERAAVDCEKKGVKTGLFFLFFYGRRQTSSREISSISSSSASRRSSSSARATRNTQHSGRRYSTCSISLSLTPASHELLISARSPVRAPSEGGPLRPRSGSLTSS